VRPTKGRLILVLGTLAEHDLIIDVIGMRDARIAFALIILLNQTLFTCADVFPVCSMLDIKHHVSTKDELSWRLRGLVWVLF
jgi:hypothetical protein